jgi:hypothetical protein
MTSLSIKVTEWLLNINPPARDGGDEFLLQAKGVFPIGRKCEVTFIDPDDVAATYDQLLANAKLFNEYEPHIEDFKKLRDLTTESEPNHGLFWHYASETEKEEFHIFYLPASRQLTQFLIDRMHAPGLATTIDVDMGVLYAKAVQHHSYDYVLRWRLNQRCAATDAKV